ncbi:tail protein X [Xanthomonas translucens]|uniref:tail protein X n=1 Tax=Xanthomonas campestris pv. translucens TaxID=343 RepID=UPI0019D5AF15|nr:tail protein X [Xanthomonas translucens]QSQ38936.1 tail protein X [Xanthomonas translucens pv. translucens]UII65664.1 tail protein X [Xanthomonas translucens]
MRVYAQQGDTVDLLCWRYLGSTTGLVEQALELNPGLAQLGLVLPHGTAVDLPEVSTTTNAAATATVQLWD